MQGKKLQRDLRNLIDVSDIKTRHDGFPLAMSGNIREVRYGFRPASKKIIPTMHAEWKGDKLICHNYGHGSAGWTLIFGTVEKSLENFQKKRLESNISFNEEITVIGMGVVGLVTAISLYFRGFTNVRIVGEFREDITSKIAGGLFEYVPTIPITDEKIREEMKSLIIHSYLTYEKINKGEHQYFKYGVRKVKLIIDDVYSDGLSLACLFDSKRINGPYPVEVTLGSDSNPIKLDLQQFETFQIDTEEFLKSTWYLIEKLKIPYTYKKINSFEEISSKVVFNCSAYGSKELANDNSLYPIAGHGLILQNQPPKEKDLDFVLLLHSIKGLEDTDYNGAIYFMAKKGNPFIGGIFCMNEGLEDRKKYESDIANLTKRARYCFQGVKSIEGPKAKF